MVEYHRHEQSAPVDIASYPKSAKSAPVITVLSADHKAFLRDSLVFFKVILMGHFYRGFGRLASCVYEPYMAEAFRGNTQYFLGSCLIYFGFPDGTVSERRLAYLFVNSGSHFFISISDICRYCSGTAVQISVSLFVIEINAFSMIYDQELLVKISWKYMHIVYLLFN